MRRKSDKEKKSAPAGDSGGAREDLRAWIWGWAKSILAVVVAWYLITTFLVQTFHITSSSMEPTLLVGDWLVVNKTLYGPEVPLVGARLPGFREPRVGDIIVFDSPIEDLKVVKRIVGGPGDTLAMADGRLLRNGAAPAEPFASRDAEMAPTDELTRSRVREWQLPYLLERTPGYNPDLWNWGPIEVPPDSYFVMGDNRGESLDSRFWGFLPQENIVGSPVFIYYSYDREVWKPFPFITAVRWGRLFHTPD